MPPSNDMTDQAAPYGSYGYPSMQPAYRQGPASRTDSSPSHDLYGQSGYQRYSQVRPQRELNRCDQPGAWVIQRSAVSSAGETTEPIRAFVGRRSLSQRDWDMLNIVTISSVITAHGILTTE